ncbi:hypothetical protein FOMPIDRAFT_1026480 [Fomitopsis schrenkii]|uniref:MYND-type domain-containing protein n=1 Tax=Fomitopsis schrenkii TaxID=2126942 RepID=S8DLG2_FOMSC|nr:hypothetical protein FOMPIDRAFT_1026480 [Fomitopsis schrenkii]
MRRNAERKIAPSDTNAERRAKGAIRNAIGFTANWMHACHFDAPAQLRPFVELCLKADLFAALDPAIPRVASMQGVAMQLIRIFFCVENVAKAAPSLLQHQLPRPHAAHALLLLAFMDPRTRAPRGPSEFDRTGVLRRDARGMPADGQFYDSAVWHMWHALESIAKPRGVCVRRVCDRAAATVCGKCGAAGYCGEECEKRDWKEHKIVCGVAVHELEPGAGGIRRITIPAQSMQSSED